MISGYATLSTLKKKKNSIYSKINKLGEKARKELTKVFDGRVITTGKGSLFMTHFIQDGISEITNSIDVAKCDSKLLHKYHFDMMVRDGIFFLPGKLGAFSNGHGEADVKKMIKATERFSENL